jgi:hypothetical protein
MKKANAGFAEKVCVGLINMNLIYALPNVYVLPATGCICSFVVFGSM